MRIRRYQAPSLREAFGLIRAELGPEAVIIGTRRIRGGVEVSAAIDYDAPLPEAPKAAAPSLGRPAARPGSPGALEALRSEIGALRQIVLGAEVLRHAPPRQAALYGWLTGRGLSAELALEVMGSLKMEGDAEAAVPPQGRQLVQLEAALTRHVSVGGFREPRPGERLACALVGPTGVGKTTMLAKLAARLLRGGRRVGLISCDCYRIGAPDQIRSYARILQVPLALCEPGGTELARAVARRSDCDTILIDTPGCSPRDSERLGELAALAEAGSQAGLGVESHLVLAATTRDEELAAAVQAFKGADFCSVMFTKLDEAERLGGCLTASRLAARPISWLGTGQRVPHDLVAASPGQVARFVLERDLSEGDDWHGASS